MTALGFGLGATGTAAASGKGGEAAIDVGDFEPDKPFYFDRFTYSGNLKVCDKGGMGVFLAKWEFHYEDDPDTELFIWTRDNAIDTSQRYVFPGKGAVDCGGFYLSPFARDK